MTMTDKNNTLKNDFEDSFEKSLKSLGYLFPSNEDEVDSFESKNKPEVIPESYCSATDLLSKSRHNLININSQLDVNKSIEYLARAARKGGDISEDIQKKMKLDRDKAENDEK